MGTVKAMIEWVAVFEGAPWALLSISIWLLLIRAQNSSTVVMILLRLPSTILHEVLGHWFVGLLFGAQPSFPSIIPRPNGKGWDLGSVAVRVDWFSSFPVAMAPLWLLPGFWILHYYGDVPPVIKAVIFPIVLQACFPSRQDFKVAFSTMRGTFFWLAIVVLGAFAVITRLSDIRS